VGAAIISYTVTNSCGSATAVYTVNVTPQPVAGTVTGTSVVCVGATTILADTAVGGTWSSSNTSIATVGSTGVVKGVSVGIAVITYTVNNSCGSARATEVVTVNSLPYAGVIVGSSTLCLDSTTILFDTAPGGTWTSGSSGIATVFAAASNRVIYRLCRDYIYRY